MLSYFSDNAIECDASEREAVLREKVPDLRLADEHILLAYKDRGGKGRDSSFFTNHRIIIKNKMGFTGKKTEYKSIPYKSIRAYSCETAGTIDSDVEVRNV